MPTPIQQVALALLGNPNKNLSSPREIRYGSHGSLSISLEKNSFFDHESGFGGGVLTFVEYIRKCDKQSAVNWLKSGFTNDKKPVYTRTVKSIPNREASARKYGLAIWDQGLGGTNNIANHPYSIKKGINWEAGVRRGPASGRIIGKYSDCLIVPIREVSTFRVVAVQCISPEGSKQTFGSLKGAGFICGNTLNRSIRWFIVEGWADAISIVFHHYHGNAVAFAACGKSSMPKLAECVAGIYSPGELIVLEDAS